MIKKAHIVAVLIVLLAIVTIVVLCANDFEGQATNETKSSYAATKETNEKPLKSEETTEKETEGATDASLTEATDVTEASTISKPEVEPLVQVTEKPEPVKPEKSYTDDELFYLAAVVCREAGGSSEEIQLLVANVVINRVNSSLYPDTIYDVLTDYRQYGMMWKYGVSFPDWADQKVKDRCYSVAKRILDGERFCPENVLFQAEFKQGSGVFKEFDGFYFCYY